MMWRAIMRRGRPIGLGAALACALATGARAEVRVEGTPQTMQVTVREEAVDGVLAALAARFDVKYRAAIPLDAAAHTIYAGSLREVLTRLLDGYNYALRNEGQATEVIVFGRRGEAAVPAPGPAKGAAPSVVSRWK